MKRLITTLTLTTLSLGCSFTKSVRPASSAKFAPSDVFANELVFRGDRAVVEKYLTSMGVEARIEQVVPDNNIYHVKYKDADYDTLAGGLEGQVDYVEPNFKVHADGRLDKYSWPNDKMFFRQWGLNNIGQSAPYGLPGSEESDIDILKAWEVAKTKGSKKIIVGVIDTGIDYTHPDLKDNMWVNTKEAPENGGVPGRDDDGNGYIDDIYGYDFYSVGATSNKWGVPGDPDPMDEDGHGTHCAGTIGALGNNAEGIVGMNWDVQLMALRFIGKGGGSTVDAVRAIYYAISKGANVLSNSWGGGGDSKALRDAIADAQKAGILFVAAAGNDGKNIDIQPTYPASIDKDSRSRPITNVLVVGASDNQDNPASFSNYGHEHVHVFAPGVHILSTFPVRLAGGAQPYVVMSGTSMATPFVAGLSALMMAANPALVGKPEAIKQIVMQTVDAKDSLIGKAASNGRINAAKAVAMKAAQAAPEKWASRAESISEKNFQRDVVDIRKEIKVPGAKAIRVHFDFIQVEEPYDSLYLYDKNLRLIAHVEDTFTRDHWSAVIPGDKVTVRFTNALVKQVTMMPAPTQTSEADCMALGAEEVLRIKPNEYQCNTDSQSSNDSKTFATFNSQGFSIDKIEYLPGEGEKK